MSNIKFERDDCLMISKNGYIKILQSKINSVCKIIGFDDSKIQWIIYDPIMRKTLLKQISEGFSGKDYGYCIPGKNIIYISTLSIQKNDSNSLFEKYHTVLPSNKYKDKDDFLANVIIDEITHFQTHCNHGSLIYDKKFKENINKYYQQQNISFWQVKINNRKGGLYGSNSSNFRWYSNSGNLQWTSGCLCSY